MNIKYISSNKEEYDLIGKRMQITDGNFHSYEWNEDAVETETGSTVYGFNKGPGTISLVWTFRGTLGERKRKIDDITNAFEHDIINLSPGRFWYGEYYIEGYVKKSSVKKSETWNNWTDVSTDIYCPYPFWIKEQTKSFYPDYRDSGEAYGFLDYPYDYPYDYSRPKKGAQNWIIDHFANCNFKMTIYGPCTNPRIIVNDHVYQVLDTLESSEYIIVESRNKTIYKYLSNGTVQNIFWKRGKDNSIFEPLPPGELLVNWNAEFGFDITAYMERSVPEWTLSEQT